MHNNLLNVDITLMYNKFLVTLLLILFTVSCNQKNEVKRISISDNGHYLTDTDGKPFYWIGDTGWAMFQRLTREEVNNYLDDRSNKGFTLIQSVIFWFPHGNFKPYGPLNETNAYGFRPFTGDADSPNTSEPLLIEGGSMDDPNDYWDHADFVVEAVKKHGLKLVLLPCWANAYINNRMPDSKIEFTEEEAYSYGKFLGERYKNEPHIIWCLGGDVDPVNFGDKDQRSVYRAMAEGIGQGVSGNDNLKWDIPHEDWNQTMMTFHAVRAPYLSGEGAEGGSSSIWFHNDPWLDFNMMETFSWMQHIYTYVIEDYNKKPTKPTVLGEGAYEGGKYGNECGFITPLKVRRQGYQAIFAGGIGYTYGHWAVWPFRGEYCDQTWKDVLDSPGADDVAGVMKNFMIDQEIYSFVPDQSIIISENPGGERQQCAMIKNDSSKVLIYLPENRDIQLDLIKMKAGEKQYDWFNTENGNRLQTDLKPDNIYSPPAGWEDSILIISTIK